MKIKHIGIVASILALLVNTVIAAPGGNRGAKKGVFNDRKDKMEDRRDDRQERCEDLFEKVDADGSGEVSV